MIEVVSPGALATIQDRGRFGYAAVGVGRAGAFDQGALALANRLVGNAADAAVVEFTLGGFAFAVHDAVTVALTGAVVPGLDWGHPVTLPAGSVVTFGMPARGVRSYLSARGGFAAIPELGSRSTDTLSELGPAPLRAGDRLPIGAEPATEVSDAAATPTAQGHTVRIVAGPRADWFAPEAVDQLTSMQWRVGADSNRIGLRLDGPALPRVRRGELASEAALPGALQIPPDGQPILFGPDSPVSGGYPVAAVVRRRDLDIVAQLRPGDPIRFTG